jgi:indole-3-glycerol phosphate synthase
VILDEILAGKRREVAALREAVLVPRFFGARTGRDTHAALRRGAGEPLRLIAEHKRRSPSAGPLSTALPPGERALRYAEAGATMVSVLCDGPFFGGSWEHVTEIRTALDEAGHPTLVLAKEFIVDPLQLALAAASGADAALLIVRIVEPAMLAELLAAARRLGLGALVEVADEAELQTALDAGARVLGVNARDLDTLVMDPQRAARVLGAMPAEVVAIHLSGLRTPDDVRAIAQTRADGALIGEALMRQDDPSALLGQMVSAATRT